MRVFYCKKCSWKSLKEKDICPDCSGKVYSKRIIPIGKVLSFTTLYITPEGFEPPVNFALIEIKNLKLITYKGDSLPLEIEGAVRVEKIKGKFYSFPITFSDKIKIYLKYFLRRFF